MASLLYFFWISITVSLGLIWALKRAESRKFPLELAFEITGWLLIVMPISARLLHAVYEEPQFYLNSPIEFLKVWKGGFVYYGGLLGGLLFSILFFKYKNRERSFWQTADFLTPVLCFGTGFGRIACFIQGCCYGTEWNGIFSIAGRHPTQLYMFFWEAILLAIVLKLEKRQLKFSGSLFLFWISASALGRFFVEFYRGDFRGQFYWGLSVSQHVALILILVSFISFLRLKRPTV